MGAGVVQGGDLEAFGEVFPVHHPGVVAPGDEGGGNAAEEHVVLGDDVDGSLYPVKDLAEVEQSPAEGFADGLMPQTDPEDAFLVTVAPDELGHDARLGWDAGPRGQDDAVVGGDGLQ